jgi:hypothetical protein
MHASGIRARARYHLLSRERTGGLCLHYVCSCLCIVLTGRADAIFDASDIYYVVVMDASTVEITIDATEIAHCRW